MHHSAQLWSLFLRPKTPLPQCYSNHLGNNKRNGSNEQDLWTKTKNFYHITTWQNILFVKPVPTNFKNERK
jgi:hypothetical protein